MLQKKWWHDKTAYQIYPKSFADSNGDGIGDLKGIINKLDYLKELGIDIIWLSPVYCSPMADQGYDISDYQAIDPRFGTMEDMEQLLAEARARNMYIIMDLVVNHCSDEHEWFRRACQDPDGQYGQLFYIEPLQDGRAPNNWRSYFGGSVWEPLPGHPDLCYLHMFHKKQPDLNWENPNLRRRIYQMINWWLDKGIAGFRIDAIINIKKPDIHRSFPADRPDGLASFTQMLRAADGIDELLQELKAETFDKYDAFTVGEVFTDRKDALQTFIGSHGHFSTMFDFSEERAGKSPDGWYASQPVVSGEAYKNCVFRTQKSLGDIAFISNIIENHDEPRGVSHYIPPEELTDTGKKMLAAVNIMLRGLPFIYQGQEIGMTNIEFHSIEEVDDCSTRDEYRVALDAGLAPKEALQAVAPFSRDNARTPFQWDSCPGAGFSTGTPWLRINPNFTHINLAEQRNRPDSVYSWYRALLSLRRDPEYKKTLVYGKLIPYLEAQKNLLAYFRRSKEAELLLLANYQQEPQTAVLPASVRKVLMNNCDSFRISGNQLQLEGYQAVILQL